MLLIALLAYAAAGEGACLAENATGESAAHLGDTGPSSQPAAHDACPHGHHHIDRLPAVRSSALAGIPLHENGIFALAQIVPLKRQILLERPPRA